MHQGIRKILRFFQIPFFLCRYIRFFDFFQNLFSPHTRSGFPPVIFKMLHLSGAGKGADFIRQIIGTLFQFHGKRFIFDLIFVGFLQILVTDHLEMIARKNHKHLQRGQKQGHSGDIF